MRRLKPSARVVAWLTAGIMLGVIIGYFGRHERLWVSIAPTSVIEQRAAIAGSGDFAGVTAIEAGLGPTFNAQSCAACHRMPSTGGTGFRTVIRVGHRAPDGAFHAPDGGTMLPASSIAESSCQAQLPDNANVIARRIPTPLYGLGLVDQIADRDIEARADPDDRDGDGVRGRPARVVDPVTAERRVGRFGWKAEDASLIVSIARAYANEIGVTNRFFRSETVVGLSPDALRACDRFADPEDKADAETGLAAIDRLAVFVRTLSPPERKPPGAAESRGEDLFAEIGCATCHHPEFNTRRGERVRAFSDFLLHDVGTGDGIAEGDAGTREMRTAPLWGVGSRPLLLHDGTAVQLDEAISAHAGEAEKARRSFDALPPRDRAALVAFLKSL